MRPVAPRMSRRRSGHPASRARKRPCIPPVASPTPFHGQGRVNSDFELDTPPDRLREVRAIPDLPEREAVPVLGLLGPVGAPAGDLVEAPGGRVVLEHP